MVPHEWRITLAELWNLIQATRHSCLLMTICTEVSTLTSEKEDSNSQEIQRRELVLQYIALFKRFGFERSVVPEAQALATKVKVANPLITWNRFQQIVDTLRKRKVLQSEFTLYLTPKALHIKLWTEWWKIHGNSFDLEEFTQDLPPKLVEWFYEMLCTPPSRKPHQNCQRSSRPKWPISANEYLKTKLGGSFF